MNMSNTVEGKGLRLGPYQVGARYPDVPEDEGRLHEAHHVETGEPALVLLPGTGDTWRTFSRWHTEVSHFTGPDALVLHPRPLAGAARPTFHELALGYIRIGAALALLDEREDVRAHFERGTRPARSRAKRWGLAGAGLALAAGLALLLCPRASAPPDTSQSPDIIFTDGLDLSFPAIAYPMPETPFPQQRRPPCLEGLEVEVRGGCWIPHARAAPCPSGAAEYQSKCYVPVRKPAPQPRSVEP
jgi:hypothetical protein